MSVAMSLRVKGGHVAAMAEVKGKEAKSGAYIFKWANEKGEFQHKDFQELDHR